jgi:Lrp/AsnC family transcriptional regulator for asnA, asnC and gidA
MTKRLLDDVDKKIMAWLSEDARVSNRKIAAALGITEGTVRGRIKRMEEDKLIQITAITNINSVPNAMVSFIWIEVEKSSDVDPVASTLKDLSRIGFVGKMVGRFDILAITMVQATAELTEFLHSTITVIPGVRRTDCTLGVDFIKQDYKLSCIVD